VDTLDADFGGCSTVGFLLTEDFAAGKPVIGFLEERLDADVGRRGGLGTGFLAVGPEVELTAARFPGGLVTARVREELDDVG
jgi:hypothetical protein